MNDEECEWLENTDENSDLKEMKCWEYRETFLARSALSVVFFRYYLGDIRRRCFIN